MDIDYDADKRDKTLAERGLDFAQAGEIFTGPHLHFPDTRANYGEDRYITFGVLDGRMVVVVWTPRGLTRRIISMRKANGREIKKHANHLG